MKLSVTTCYSHILFMQLQGEKFADAIRSVKMSAPNFGAEGFNGYIEVTAEFEIKSLATFTEIYNAWYTYSKRSEFYADIKGKYFK